jgi:hypothetical protein
MSARVVLVHGAWHGAWCWDAVVDGLRAEGITADAVDLPGHGDDTMPLTDLYGDAARVTAALDALITEAGVHPSVAHLVYLAALNLDEGETMLEAALDDPRAADIDHTGRPEFMEHLTMLEDGSATVSEKGALALFYNECPAELAAEAVPRLTPQPLLNMGQSPTRVAWRERPSTYVVCARDNAVHPDLQRILADRCTDAVEWDTDHSPFLADPARVTAFLAALARSL